jgi:hypothetical protein
LSNRAASSGEKIELAIVLILLPYFLLKPIKLSSRIRHCSHLLPYFLLKPIKLSSRIHHCSHLLPYFLLKPKKLSS